jgi:hypothetical protein
MSLGIPLSLAPLDMRTRPYQKARCHGNAAVANQRQIGRDNNQNNDGGQTARPAGTRVRPFAPGDKGQP